MNTFKAESPFIFALYNAGAQGRAEKILQQIEENGYNCWVLNHHLAKGKGFVRLLLRYLSKCRIVLVLYDSNYGMGSWEQEVLSYAKGSHKDFFIISLDSNKQACFPEVLCDFSAAFECCSEDDIPKICNNLKDYESFSSVHLDHDQNNSDSNESDAKNSDAGASEVFQDNPDRKTAQSESEIEKEKNEQTILRKNDILNLQMTLLQTLMEELICPELAAREGAAGKWEKGLETLCKEKKGDPGCKNRYQFERYYNQCCKDGYNSVKIKQMDVTFITYLFSDEYSNTYIGKRRIFMDHIHKLRRCRNEFQHFSVIATSDDRTALMLKEVDALGNLYDFVQFLFEVKDTSWSARTWDSLSEKSKDSLLACQKSADIIRRNMLKA